MSEKTNRPAKVVVPEEAGRFGGLAAAAVGKGVATSRRPGALLRRLQHGQATTTYPQGIVVLDAQDSRRDASVLRIQIAFRNE